MKRVNKTRPDFIFETKYWEVYLNPDQYYLGRSVVVAKRKVGNLSDLRSDEWLDFANLVKKFEWGIRKAFGATMFNWACLVNNAYQNNPPDPQVHWHFRPRYDKPCRFMGIEFKDEEFGHHYARGTDFTVPEKTFQGIVEEIKKEL